MISQLISDGLLKDVKDSPANNHWSQSPLEKVTEAKILLSGRDFALARTTFLAPKLVRHSYNRTEEIGDAYHRLFELANNMGSHEKFVREFHTYDFPESYQPGNFGHIDYTLWVCNPRNKAFVNLRQYPEGSYLVDLINADVSSMDEVRGGIVASYVGDSENNDPLPPKRRTKTLDQLARQNRMRQATVVLRTPEGDYEAPFEEGPMVFVNPLDSSTLHFFEISDDVRDRIYAADRTEVALQRLLTHFKHLLDESGVAYRK